MSPKSRSHVLVAALALLAGGCTDRANEHAVDTLYLTPTQEKDVFLASDHLGPDTQVVVLANVPKARYENGAIVLTGGREMVVVQPNAWRTYTGTAVSVEEAQRLIARAEKLDQAIRDVGAAASDLRVFLESRSRDAKTESERMKAQDTAWRAEQERQAQRMLEEAGAVRRARDQETSRIVAERDVKVSGIYKQGSQDIQAITDRFAAEVAQINDRYAKLEAQAQAEHKARAEKLAKTQQLEASIAQQKDDVEYLHRQQELHERQRQDLAAELSKAVEGLHGEQEAEVARVRADAARQVDDARRLSEEKAERVRVAAESQIAEVRARHALPEPTLTASTSSPAPAMAVQAEAPAAPAAAQEDAHAQ